MDSQSITVVIALTILASAIAAPVFVFMWWREKQKRITLNEELSVANGIGKKAVEIGRKLLADKKALAAKVAQIEQRFRPVLDLDAKCADLNQRIAVSTAEISQLRASSVTFPDII